MHLFKISVFCVVALCINCFIGNVLADNKNYPTQDHNPKPCARLKNTVTYQKPLCVPDCKGGFKYESSENCKTDFRLKCPEFNEGECQWYNLKFDSGLREIPTCRLKYHAKSKTWMEVFYTHQYGLWMTDKTWSKFEENCSPLPICDVVEVHRFIKEESAFGNRTLGDWPDSVIDPEGERGLNWKIFPYPVPYPSQIMNNQYIKYGLCTTLRESDSCETDKNCGHYQAVNVALRKICEVDMVHYFKTYYPLGLDYKSNPKASSDENPLNSSVSTNLVGTCIDVRTADGIVRRGCQVLYTRSTVYTPSKGDKYKCEFVYLEANVYDLDVTDNATNLQMRFAYWFAEGANERNKISCSTKV